MMHYTKLEFVADDGGAVTVDWVVLCAAVVGLAGLAVSQITVGAVSVGERMSASVSK